MCELKEGRASFKFPQLFKKLKNLLSPILEILRDKSELEFKELSISWGRGQAAGSEIGQILSCFKRKSDLEGVSVSIDEGNMVEKTFCTSLVDMVTRNKVTLEMFSLQVCGKCNKDSVDVLSPILRALEGYERMRTVDISFEGNNFLEVHPLRYQVPASLRRLSLQLYLLENRQELNGVVAVKEGGEYQLDTFILKIQTQSVLSKNLLDLGFINTFGNLKSLDLQLSRNILSNINVCLSHLEELSLELSDVSGSCSLQEVLLSNAVSLRKLSLGLLHLEQFNEQDILLLGDFIRDNTGLEHLSITLSLGEVSHELASRLTKLSNASIPTSISITLLQPQTPPFLYLYLIDVVRSLSPLQLSHTTFCVECEELMLHLSFEDSQVKIVVE